MQGAAPALQYPQPTSALALPARGSHTVPLTRSGRRGSHSIRPPAVVIPAGTPPCGMSRGVTSFSRPSVLRAPSIQSLVSRRLDAGDAPCCTGGKQVARGDALRSPRRPDRGLSGVVGGGARDRRQRWRPPSPRHPTLAEGAQAILHVVWRAICLFPSSKCRLGTAERWTAGLQGEQHSRRRGYCLSIDAAGGDPAGR